VCDRGYLRHQRQWRDRVAGAVECSLIQVEGGVLVPVEVASDRAETPARTLRPKLARYRKRFLKGLTASTLAKDPRPLSVGKSLDLSIVDRVLRLLDPDRSVRPVRGLRVGSREARRRLATFLPHRLAGYDEKRNEPAGAFTSELSPYLHFGQISPVDIALNVGKSTGSRARDRESYLEELLVRRELAVSFVHFTPNYDEYGSLPSWARSTLDAHRGDRRDHVYTRAQLDSAATHDRYWNAAMREMVHTGFMHNYMRMYWGKKILEWSNTPEHAYRTALYLNNRYFLDGRDASSFANVAWCFGLHDRGWHERGIYGTVRYMNDRGLERKFDMEGYIERMEALLEGE
jgi:deoxyribodipyrimidine photo-lyase